MFEIFVGQLFRKRSISPLIATILLVVVAVALIAILLTWGKGFTTDSLNETTKVYDDSDLTGYVWFKSNQGNNIFIENRHTSEDLNIIGYKINSDKNYPMLNKKIFIDPVLIESNSLSKLSLVCLPSKSFEIDLLTNKNKFISVNANLNDYKLNSCFDYNLVVFFDFSKANITDSKLIDLSGNNNDVTLLGGEKVDNGFKVDDVGEGGYFESNVFPGGEFTIASRLYSFSFSGSGYLIANYTTTIYELRLNQNSVSINFGGTDPDLVFDTSLPLNEFYDLVIKRDSNDLVEVYLNGEKIGSKIMSGETIWNRFLIQKNANPERILDGIISDFRLYDYSWNQSQVKDYHKMFR